MQFRTKLTNDAEGRGSVCETAVLIDFEPVGTFVVRLISGASSSQCQSRAGLGLTISLEKTDSAGQQLETLAALQKKEKEIEKK